MPDINIMPDALHEKTSKRSLKNTILLEGREVEACRRE